MADDKKRKYLLFSKDDGRPDHLKPCAFFLSDAGCKNGDKCKFAHQKPNEPTKGNNERPVAKPVIESAPVTMPNKHSSKNQEVKSAEKKQKKEEYVESRYVEPPKYVEPKRVESKYTPAPVVAVKDAKDDQISELKAMLLQQQQMFAEQMKQVAQMQQKPPAPVVEKSTPKQSAKEKGKEIAAKRASKANSQPTPVPFVINTPAPPGLHKPQQYQQPAAAESNSDSDSDNSVTSDDESDFLFGAVNVALKDGRNSFSNQESISSESRKALPSPPPAIQKNTAPAHDLNATSGIPKAPIINVSDAASMFVTADNIVKNLQTSGTKHATHGNTKKNVFANPKNGTSVSTATSNVVGTSAPNKVRETVAVFDPSKVDFATLPWTNLVITCQSHLRYKKEYTYDVDSSWVKSRPVGDWCAGRAVPSIIAIDCEMCETADPVTGAKDNSLIRLSIVNGLKPSEVIIDTLVVPANPITEMRSHIHGITEEHLKDQKFTLRQAQAFLYNLCSENTIIVGHSVHNDLKSLHFQHYNIIDTSYLYTLENEPNAAASVRDISEQVLGVKLSEIHDSIQDARSALYVASVILISGPHRPLQRTSGNLSSSAKNAAQSFPHLLVHRIPDYCNDEHITEMIVKYTQIMPAKVHPITRGAAGNGDNAPSGKALVQFASQSHADLAFDSIVGPNRPDKQNRSQKRIYLKGGGYICVRK